MKISRYNVYLPHNNGSRAIYNLISGRFETIDQSLATLLLRYGKKQIPLPRLLTMHIKSIPALVKAGIIIDDAVDELARYRSNHLQKKFHDPLLRVVVMPTLQCNLRCHYCYEMVRQFGHATMSEELALKLISFVNQKMDQIDCISLVFSLFGGEPLMNPRICDLLLEAMHSACQRRNIPYHFPLTTNGYLISDLREHPVLRLATSVHLTLDGDKSQHDQTRISASGTPSYDKILEGIQFLVNQGTRTIIRIHFNHLSQKGLIRILDDLQQIGVSADSQIHLYLMNVMENPMLMFEQRCGPPQTDQLPLLWAQVKKFHDALIGHPLFSRFHWESHFPTETIELRYLSCNHESNSLFTVNADGHFIKCPRFIGDPDCTVGRFNDNGDVDWTASQQNMLQTSRFENDTCLACEYLPVCGSNCVFKPLPQSLEECYENRRYYRQQVEKYVEFKQSAREQARPMTSDEVTRESVSL